MPNQLSVTVANGKYTVVQDESGRLSALRYGEPWRDCVGDNLILALAQELQELRDKFCAICGRTIELPASQRDVMGRLWCKNCEDHFDSIDHAVNQQQ